MNDGIGHYNVPAIDLTEKKTVREASRNSSDNSSRIERLEKKLETLSIINEVLWGVVSESENITLSKLKEMMVEVELDRTKRNTAKVECGKCKLSIPANKTKCMYCGTDLVFQFEISPFDSL